MPRNILPRYYGVVRRADNRVKVGPDMGGRKHKSLLILYFREQPKFKVKTYQQKIIGEVGKFCGDLIRGRFEGGGEMWVKRKKAYLICTRTIFSKAGNDLRKVEELLKNEEQAAKLREEIEFKLNQL